VCSKIAFQFIHYDDNGVVFTRECHSYTKIFLQNNRDVMNPQHFDYMFVFTLTAE